MVGLRGIHIQVKVESVIRLLLCERLAIAFAIASLSQAGFAQSPLPDTASGYPARAIRLVVPIAAGGGGDIMARAVGQKLSENMGQPVVVDNRPGGSTIIGTEFVAKAAPDGYTLVLATSSHAINPALIPKIPFDPIKRFAAVTLFATSPLMLVVHPSVPAKSVKELVALAKKRPGKLNFASGGNAGLPHLAAELFKLMAGVDMAHIPYKGMGPALIEILGGQVDLLFSTPVASLPHVKNGKLQALAMTGPARSPATPGLPTVAESGYAGYEASAWYAILAPAAVPLERIDRLNREVQKIIQVSDFRERFAGLGVELVRTTPEECLAYIKSEMTKWSKVIKVASVRVD